MKDWLTRAVIIAALIALFAVFWKWQTPVCDPPYHSGRVYCR